VPVRTTLLVPVLEARVLLDRVTNAPSDPHVTLAFPFMDAEAINDDVVAALRERFARFPAFEFSLASTVRFGDVLFLSPEPAEPFRELVRALASGEPPYEMPVTDIWPHVTVSASVADLDRVEAELKPALPITCRAREAYLQGDDGHGGWRTMATFPLKR
jgi:2'-5' RNA ligase